MEPRYLGDFGNTTHPIKDPSTIHSNRAWITHTVVALCFILSTLVVICRIWSRYFILRRMGLDDLLAIVSLLAVIGEGVSMLYEVEYGMGRHLATLDSNQMWKFERTFYVTVVVYTAALLFLKLTFLIQYYRVLAVQHMRIWYISSIIIVTLWGVSQLMVSILICIPIRGYWDSSVRARCIPAYPQVYINATGNVITDVMILLLPMPAIWQLNVPAGQKRALLGIFSLGFLTVAISIVRFQYLKRSDDVTWTNVVGSSWSLAEITCALVCACLPTLKPVLSKCLPFLRPRVTSRSPLQPGYSARRLIKFSRSSPTDITGTTVYDTSIAMDTMNTTNSMTTTLNQSMEDLHHQPQQTEVGNLELDISANYSEYPWAYIPDQDLGSIGEAQMLRIQHDLGLALTTKIEVTSPENQGDIPQSGTIRVDTEITVVAE
ncbi:hypothetical protein CFIMG_002350RA [Ceratocystis fimbriata CBS 114723]|uniref:Rhodopsin domain-containing protein n=1 Tax=Ceratocystis fimbriata CBS 114723 TaxID=1035309 RepID=A0A2C5WYR2_9PEZI|nr:hypothetical protein CFIMG_002350RA [Ceratocystis fimbriata CBS 114723]